MSDKKKGESEKLLHCSFCGKSQHEVKKLIVGPNVYICDECIDLCNEIVRDEIQAEIDNMSPMGRMVTPEEVAETAAWLCLPSSASITGQAIVIAGGAVMQ